MSSRDEILAQFIEISGCEENVAEFYLSSADWSLELALSTFLGAQTEGDGAAGEPPHRREAGQQDVSTDLGPREATPSDPFPVGGSARARFATLNDMSKKNSSSSDEEEGQAFYAGGSDRSGQQVLGPPKRKNFKDKLTDMFRMAHAHSAADTEAMPSTSSGASTWGQGVRLGVTATDHTVVEPAKSEKETEKKPPVVLKLWREGFSIDNGELRRYDDPNNKQFLETVMRGEIPQELLELGWMVNVDIEDHRHESYKQTTGTVQTFKGSGHALGSFVPNIESPSTAAGVLDTPPTPSEDKNQEKKNEEDAKAKLGLNAAAPNTTLQIRLADGSRLIGQFNLTHTVGDIHNYIQNARPQYANRSFYLVSSFPTRELKELDVTIEGAGLKNAALMQRLN